MGRPDRRAFSAPFLSPPRPSPLRLSSLCVCALPVAAVLLLTGVPHAPAGRHASLSLRPARRGADDAPHARASAPRLAAALRPGLSEGAVTAAIGAPFRRVPITRGVAWFYHCRDGTLEVGFAGGRVRSCWLNLDPQAVHGAPQPAKYSAP